MVLDSYCNLDHVIHTQFAFSPCLHLKYEVFKNLFSTYLELVWVVGSLNIVLE